MELKSICDCLNIIDDAIVENNVKYIGISNLENFHKYLLEIGQSDFIEVVALSNVLRRINFIIENHHQFVEEDIRSEHIQFTKLVLDWVEECNTKPEVNDQQYS